jgi:hypothetical protein
VTTPRHAGLSTLARCLLLGLCAATPTLSRAQDLLDSTPGTAPGPSQRSVTETGDIPAELEPEPTPGQGPAPGTVKAGGTGVHWSRAPIRVKGEVDLLHTYTRPSGLPTMSDTLLYTKVGGSTYLKAPWFSTLDMGLGMSKNVDKVGDNRTDTLTFTGDSNFVLFPLSRFPFHAYAERTNSRVNEALVGTSQYTSTTLGLDQSYTPLNSPATFAGSLIYNRLEGDRFGKDTQMSGSGSMVAALDQHRVTVMGTGISDKRKDDQERSNIYSLSAKDEYHDADSLAIISLASANRSSFQFVGSETRSSFAQATTSGSWTPSEDIPLQLTGAIYMNTANTQSYSSSNSTLGGPIEVKTQGLGSSVGATYRWSKNLRLSGMGSANVTRVRDIESRTTRANSSATYSSDAVPLWGFAYNYGLSGNATLTSNRFSGSGSNTTTVSSSSSAQTAESASHSLSKNTVIDPITLFTTRLTQGVSATQQKGQNRTSLDHSGAVAWSESGESRQLYAGVTLSDQRSNGFSVDMINGQLSASGDVGRYSTVSAAVTLQASRQTVSGTDSSGPGSDTQTSTTRNAGAEATYVNTRSFGVLRLKFSSILRYDTFTRDARFTGTVGAPSEDIRMVWENRFDYTMGLLTLQLLGRVTHSAGKTDSLLFASAQRKFGGFY